MAEEQEKGRTESEETNPMARFKRACADCLRMSVEVVEEVIPRNDPNFSDYVRTVHSSLSMLFLAPYIGRAMAGAAGELREWTQGGM